MQFQPRFLKGPDRVCQFYNMVRFSARNVNKDRTSPVKGNLFNFLPSMKRRSAISRLRIDLKNCNYSRIQVARARNNCITAKRARSEMPMLVLPLFRICFASDIPAVFVFGDSLLDVGNNNYIVSLSKANFFPNGIDFGGPTGRFTNGRTIVDILGQQLGLGSIPPYLAPTTRGSAVLHGVNYASGGGGILNHTGNFFGGRINLDAQIDNFANTRQDIVSSHGISFTLNLFSKSIFSVVMGSNDFINNYLTPVLSIPERKSVSPELFVATMISRFRQQLTRLYGLGARKIVVANVGPIGCIPFQRELNTDAGDNCAAFPNQLAQLFNTQLKKLSSELNTNLAGSSFVYADVYHILEDILQNYSSYGFENPNSACCYLAGRVGGLIPCIPKSEVCADRSKYVFWDAYHPSDAANVIIAKRLLDGDTNDISPVNVRQLVHT
ncbi:hypothetical protein L6164_013675 [Bauhinia variegata]|uniref:Uncharacterized protein n=1 Tax=Bauhinia variegata TaxID=167791 RepID=A0ACB9NJT8_BAUVA|nr:hypothetical protein L6164_013675 [Bauhinia variegata]